MSVEAEGMNMKSVQKLDSVRRQAWLAGIGALDTGRALAADKFDKIFVDSGVFINQLCAKGESLDAPLRATLRSRKMLDKKIAFLREKLGMSSVNRDQQLEALSTKVDALIDVVAKLALQKSTAKPAAKPDAKPAAKPATKVVAKAAAKAVAKPAAKAVAKPAEKAPAKPAAKPTTSEAASKPAETKKD
ncbi:MAG: hypothetical protein ACI965_001249 [Paraglaciecola sp.]|jgi:hypothetical protein